MIVLRNLSKNLNVIKNKIVNFRELRGVTKAENQQKERIKKARREIHTDPMYRHIVKSVYSKEIRNKYPHLRDMSDAEFRTRENKSFKDILNNYAPYQGRKQTITDAQQELAKLRHRRNVLEGRV